MKSRNLLNDNYLGVSSFWNDYKKTEMFGFI